MPTTVEEELKEATDRILQSPSRKKLVVAGPGTGKTTLFHKLLEETPGAPDSRLVLTFINNLKRDLEADLAHLSSVYTLHGYCQSQLRKKEALRGALTADFRCLPDLPTIIKRDWEFLKGGGAPQFVKRMRDLRDGEELAFFRARADYYNAVGFDDSVFRVYKAMEKDESLIEPYNLVLIDEYQDFNRMEAAFIAMLAQASPIVIAGDDDQALYSRLRGSTWEFIRSMHGGDEYEVFELPFCMRCPEVIVDAVNDVLSVAREAQRLVGRIAKPFRHFAPVKGEDSRRYPKIDLVTSTVQRKASNYWGQYIEVAVGQMPESEIEQAAEKGDAAVLIIGAKHYLRQVVMHLEAKGYEVDMKRDANMSLQRDEGLEILSEEPSSNLGWRVILHFEEPELVQPMIAQSYTDGTPLVELVPEDLRQSVRAEAESWSGEEGSGESDEAVTVEEKTSVPTIKATSFEGSKGLSAQHVFIVGMHDGDLPGNPSSVEDIEICRFVVGMTRAKKKCTLMSTGRFGAEPRQPSSFLSWIKDGRYNRVNVNAAYWKGR